MKLCIFDIKRFAIHDGPGIRVTVFLKGCPLSCWWCHNPEGIPKEPSTHTEVEVLDGIRIERNVEVGRWVEPEELMSEIQRDRIYMEETGGGVTFSGGEPLMQAGPLLHMLDLCRRAGIHTCVDTSGYASPRIIKEVCDRTDLLLFDLKSMNEDKHREYTGVSNKRILQNLVTAMEGRARTITRIPLVPGFNDQDEEIHALRDFLKRFDKLEQVDILPYHRYANNKYKRFRTQNRMETFDAPSRSQIERTKDIFESAGFKVMTGG